MKEGGGVVGGGSRYHHGKRNHMGRGWGVETRIARTCQSFLYFCKVHFVIETKHERPIVTDRHVKVKMWGFYRDFCGSLSQSMRQEVFFA